MPLPLQEPNKREREILDNKFKHYCNWLFIYIRQSGMKTQKQLTDFVLNNYTDIMSHPLC